MSTSEKVTTDKVKSQEIIDKLSENNQYLSEIKKELDDFSNKLYPNENEEDSNVSKEEESENSFTGNVETQLQLQISKINEIQRIVNHLRSFV